MAISPQLVIQSTPCLVPSWIYRVGESNGAIPVRSNRPAAILEHFEGILSLEWVIRATFMK